MLCLFLKIAHTLMFSKTWFIFLDLKSKLSSSLKICLISFWISRHDPGNMQHNLSFLFLLEERTVTQAEVFCFFIFSVFDEGQTTLLQRLPLEDNTVRYVDVSLETSVSSSSEATAAASRVMVPRVSTMIPSPIWIRVVSACVSRVPW